MEGWALGLRLDPLPRLQNSLAALHWMHRIQQSGLLTGLSQAIDSCNKQQNHASQSQEADPDRASTALSETREGSEARGQLTDSKDLEPAEQPMNGREVDGVEPEGVLRNVKEGLSAEPPIPEEASPHQHGPNESPIRGLSTPGTDFAKTVAEHHSKPALQSRESQRALKDLSSLSTLMLTTKLSKGIPLCLSVASLLKQVFFTYFQN